MASDTNFSPNGRWKRALDELAGPRGMPMRLRVVRTHQVKERDTGPDGLLLCEIVDCIYPDEPIAVEKNAGQWERERLHASPPERRSE